RHSGRGRKLIRPQGAVRRHLLDHAACHLATDNRKARGGRATAAGEGGGGGSWSGRGEGVRVPIGLALEVAEDDVIAFAPDHVLGEQWYFAAAAGGVNDELR